MPSPRIVMFGIQCAFTDAVAAELTRRGLAPSALFLPGHPKLEQPSLVGGPQATLPIAGSPRTSAHINYPTFRVGRLTSPSTLELIESFKPDVVVIACFPRLIPRQVRDIPRFTSLNVHPSLLPAHRGPDPLFWIMRDGGRGCGVTVHELSDSFDSGDILAQRAVPFPDGIREPELELLLASTGAGLVAEVVASLTAGRLHRHPQDEHAASYESWPGVADFVTSVDRLARDAWNFARGVAGRGVPIRVETEAEDIYITDAVELALGETAPAPTKDGEIVIKFRDGWLVARELDRSPD